MAAPYIAHSKDSSQEVVVVVAWKTDLNNRFTRKPQTPQTVHLLH